MRPSGMRCSSLSRTTGTASQCAPISPEMALRVEKAFGVSMDTLMRMQNSYDIAQARKREGEINVAPFKGKPLDPQAALI